VGTTSGHPHIIYNDCRRRDEAYQILRISYNDRSTMHLGVNDAADEMRNAWWWWWWLMLLILSSLHPDRDR